MLCVKCLVCVMMLCLNDVWLVVGIVMWCGLMIVDDVLLVMVMMVMVCVVLSVCVMMLMWCG